MQKFFTSWKTSLAGAVAIAVGILSLFGITIPIPGLTSMTSEAAIGMIITGLGLLAAKDSNVTGGTKPQ